MTRAVETALAAASSAEALTATLGALAFEAREEIENLKKKKPKDRWQPSPGQPRTLQHTPYG
jgi:hypothetical protein